MMATITAIRDALKTTIEANISGLRVFATMPDVTEGHSLLVEPVEASFSKAFQRGTDEWTFNMYVMVPWVETRKAQDNLDPYVSGSGTKSVRQVIFNNNTLGGVVDDAFVKGMRGYGGHFQIAKIAHVGAILDLTVITSGTA